MKPTEPLCPKCGEKMERKHFMGGFPPIWRCKSCDAGGGTGYERLPEAEPAPTKHNDWCSNQGLPVSMCACCSGAAEPATQRETLEGSNGLDSIPTNEVAFPDTKNGITCEAAHPSPAPEAATDELCRECVIHFIAREGSFFPCALEKHHIAVGHRAAGNCFKHGPYLGEIGAVPQCPKWPDCIPVPQPAPVASEFTDEERLMACREASQLEFDSYSFTKLWKQVALKNRALSELDELKDQIEELKDKHDARLGWWAEEYKKIEAQLLAIREATVEMPPLAYEANGNAYCNASDVREALTTSAQQKAALEIELAELRKGEQS